MRISLATVGLAVLGALLVACSSTVRGGWALPAGSPSPLSSLDIKPRGVSLSPATRAAFMSQVERGGHDASAVRIWVTNPTFSYLLGLDKSGKNVVDAIHLQSRGCLTPNGVKVDGSQNVWVACQNDPSNGYASSEQEYSGTGVLRHSYHWTAPCPQSASLCAANGGGDGGPDSSGHVFAEMGFAATLIGGIQHNLDSGFYWWSASRPTEKPKFISLGPSCEPICQPEFIDTDRFGNIWFTYVAYVGAREAFGLGEIISPTTKPQFVSIFAPHDYPVLTGVFTSHNKTILNVVDQTKRKIYQYKLPLTPTSRPLNSLGPTTIINSGGFPTSGSFNKTETGLVLGDSAGWVNIGTIPSNRWKSPLNLRFFPATGAASYTPSDR